MSKDSEDMIPEGNSEELSLIESEILLKDAKIVSDYKSKLLILL